MSREKMYEFISKCAVPKPLDWNQDPILMIQFRSLRKITFQLLTTYATQHVNLSKRIRRIEVQLEKLERDSNFILPKIKRHLDELRAQQADRAAVHEGSESDHLQ
jgi:hypothetical protein